MTRYGKVTYGFSTLVFGLSVLLIWTATVSPARMRGDTDAGAQQQFMPALPNIAGDTISAYSDIAERPIFVPSRRPPPRAGDDLATAPASATPPFSVIGIIAAHGDKLIAVKHAGDKEATSLRVGQSLDGWTIVDVRNNAVILASGDARHTLRLADDKNGGSEP